MSCEHQYCYSCEIEEDEKEFKKEVLNEVTSWNMNLHPIECCKEIRDNQIGAELEDYLKAMETFGFDKNSINEVKETWKLLEYD